MSPYFTLCKGLGQVLSFKQVNGLVLTALLVVQLLFGINYVVSKAVVNAFPPLIWAFIRVGVSAALLLGIACAFRRKKAPEFNIQFFGPLVLFSLLGVVINQGAFLVGLHYTTAINASILNTLIPIFTLMIVTLRGQEQLTWTRGLGFFFAFTGVLILRKVEQLSLSDKTLIGDLLMILNCLSFSLFLTFSKRFLEKHDGLWATTWLFVFGTVGFGVISLPSWLEFSPPPMSPVLWGCMAFVILGSTLLAYFLNLWALARTRSSSVALFIYIQPVIASLLAWLWFGEVITFRTVAASLLIFVGMLLGISRSKSSPEIHDAAQ